MAKKPKEKAAKPADDQLPIDKQREELFELAKKEGHIDQKEIFKVFPETPENAEALDALYTELADSNIEITTAGIDPALNSVWEAEEPEEEG